MSGGSRGYIYNDIGEHLCGMMYDRELNDLMNDIKKLAHDVEWYDSTDICWESYEKNVHAFKEKWFEGDRKARLRGYIDEAITQVRRELYALIGEELHDGEGVSE